MTTKTIHDFFTYFNELSEREKFNVGKLFTQETGGKLSAFNSPTPVVVALLQLEVQGDIKLLAIKRAIAPHIGGIALPGGFLDQGEEGHVGVAREVLEETGFKTAPEDYSIFGNPLLSPTNNLLIFYKNNNVYDSKIIEDFKINKEVSSFELIDQDTTLCFSLHQEKANDFFSSPELKNSERLLKKYGNKM